MTLNDQTYEYLDKCLIGVVSGSIDCGIVVSEALSRMLKPSELLPEYSFMISLIKTSMEFVGSTLHGKLFTLELLTDILESDLSKFVQKNKEIIQSHLVRQGMTLKLDNADDLLEYSSILYSDIYALYQSLRTETPPTIDSINFNLKLLANNLLDIANQEAIEEYIQIRNEGKEVWKYNKYGKKTKQFLSGVLDAHDNLVSKLSYFKEKYAVNEGISNRHTVYRLDNLDADNRLLNDHRSMWGNHMAGDTMVRLNYGPLGCEISWGDIMAILADEGVGKTKFLRDIACKALDTGTDVLLVATEIDALEDADMIKLHQLYDYTKNPEVQQRYGLRCPLVQDLKTINYMKQLAGVVESNLEIADDGKHAEIKQKIQNTLSIYFEAVENSHSEDRGVLSVVQNFSIKDVQQRMMEFVKQEKNLGRDSWVICIDSISFLDYDGVEGKRNVDTLMKACDYVRSCTGTPFIITNHTGTDQSKLSAKGKTISSPRISADSSAVSKYASKEVLLSSTPEMRELNLIKVEDKKARRKPGEVSSVILRRIGENDVHEYFEEDQISQSIEDDLDLDQKWLS